MTGAPPGSSIRRPALFASSFHPHLGGVEELVRQLARAEQATGAEPVVHTMRWPRSLPARERWQGLDIRRHAYRAPEGSLRRVATAMVGNPVVLADVTTQMRRDRADLVHVQCVSHGAWFAHQAARALDLPLVVTLQGELTMDADDVYAHSPMLRHTLRLLLRRADRVTACSAATLAEAEAWAGEDLGERGSVIPNGIDLREFDLPPAPIAPPTDGPYVVALGRHVAQKGFDVLLEAFALAAGSTGVGARNAVRSGLAAPTLGPQWYLVIAGDGPERDALEEQARRLGLAERVRFPGRVERAAVVALLRGAEVFVLPSRHEPFGIVNLEAMAARTPVVATDVGGVGEFVRHGSNGVLVPPQDPRALAAALVALAGDPDRRTRLAAAGRVTAEAHDWAAIEGRYREVYAAAAAARPGRGAGRRRRGRLFPRRG